MNLLFCGLPKSGKTTIGKLVSDKLGWSFIDTDQLIETSEGLPCREVFKQKGEVYFRTIEKHHIASLQVTTNSVIALGGGSLCDPENLKAIKSLGCLIYLKVSPQLLWARMSGTPPYAQTEAAFYEMAKIRESLYETAADVTIENSSLEETWRAIHLELFSKL